MRIEEIISKAAERGIQLDEAAAEKYVNLSDEELANLDIAGGGCNGYDESKCIKRSEFGEIFGFPARPCRTCPNAIIQGEIPPISVKCPAIGAN